jgi:hypothetical protein
MSSRNNNIVSIIVRLPSFLNPSLRKRKRRTKDNKDNSPSSKDEFCYLNKPSLLTTTIIQGKGASKNGKLRTLFVTENGFIYRENASKSYQKKNKESLKQQKNMALCSKRKIPRKSFFLLGSGPTSPVNLDSRF